MKGGGAASVRGISRLLQGKKKSLVYLLGLENVHHFIFVIICQQQRWSLTDYSKTVFIPQNKPECAVQPGARELSVQQVQSDAVSQHLFDPV